MQKSHLYFSITLNFMNQGEYTCIYEEREKIYSENIVTDFWRATLWLLHQFVNVYSPIMKLKQQILQEKQVRLKCCSFLKFNSLCQNIFFSKFCATYFRELSLWQNNLQYFYKVNITYAVHLNTFESWNIVSQKHWPLLPLQKKKEYFISKL